MTAIVIVKERPLERGHLLTVTWSPDRNERRPKKNAGCTVQCSCKPALVLVHGSARQYQSALDMAARSHRSEITFGDYRYTSLLEQLRAELEHLDVDDVIDRYGNAA